MGGLKRDQRQTAASREPQTHRDGMFPHHYILLLELFQLVAIARAEKLMIFVFCPANGAVQGCRTRNKNKSLLKRRPGPRSEGGSSSEGKGGNGTVANGNIYILSDSMVSHADGESETERTNK